METGLPHGEQEPRDVPATHDFFDMDQNIRFAAKQDARPERRVLFEGFIREVRAFAAGETRVLEVGSGYGALAAAILRECNVSQYVLFDYSPQMHELSRARLREFASKTRHVVGSFKEAGWTAALDAGFDVLVTIQTVHELRHARRIPALYRQLATLLRPGGLLLLSDPVNNETRQRDHYLTPEQHIRVLQEAGFEMPAVVLMAGEQPLIRGFAPERES